MPISEKAVDQGTACMYEGQIPADYCIYCLQD